MVEYVYYCLIVLAMLVALLIWLPLPSRSRLPDDLTSLVNTARQRRLSKKKQKNPGVESDRDVSKVPTPWGWPHYAKNAFDYGRPVVANGHVHSISESFHSWADRLVQEKHTVEDEEYKLRREGWIRTLVEDRYGRSAMMAPTTYAKRSGVPMPPHEQMGNNSSGRAHQIEARLSRKGQTGKISNYTHLVKQGKRSSLENLKLPWGW